MGGDVFEAAAGATGQFLRDAAIDAGYELGVFSAVDEPRTLDQLAERLAIGAGRRRLAALLDVLVALGALEAENNGTSARYVRGSVPARPAIPRAGWALMADVIRSDQALPLHGSDHERRLHRHLAQAGAAAARELAPMLGSTTLLDLGGGAGAYTAAVLDAYPSASATLVDQAEVIDLAREHLTRFGDRVRFIAGDIRTAETGDDHGAVLLANVLHLHGAPACAAMCAVAARAAAPGGIVVVKDLRMDEGRAGPIEGLLFALNMAIYTDDGDVYEASQIATWLERAGLVAIEERRLEVAPDAFAIIGRKPREALARFHDVTGLPDVSAIERELDDRAGAVHAVLPRPLRSMLAHAIALDRGAAAPIIEHYTSRLPVQRANELAAAPGHELLHVPLQWQKLPRMTAAIDRLFGLLVESDVDPSLPLGAASAAAFRASTPTIAALHARSHYGGLAPLLYGHPLDLAYFARSGDAHAAIDRYLVAPVLHELGHFGRDRDALPPHLDEAIGGWIGAHVWPELAFPAVDQDDALYAAPWLAQIGQAFARAFGIAPIVRAQTGAVPWDAVLPPAFVDELCRCYWDDWRARRSLHLLCDTAVPRPWVERVLARPLADDPKLDLAIVADALRAMCLATVHVDGRVRARSQLPDSAIAIDATTWRVSTPAATYWLPPPVAERLLAYGISAYELRLSTLAAIPIAAAVICGASRGIERDGFALRVVA